jgi:hypothetical protein
MRQLDTASRGMAGMQPLLALVDISDLVVNQQYARSRKSDTILHLRRRRINICFNLVFSYLSTFTTILYFDYWRCASYCVQILCN